MNRDDIIRMARQASTGAMPLAIFTIEELETFAALVASAEREACAKVCEEQYEYYGFDHVFAKAIRERGQA